MLKYLLALLLMTSSAIAQTGTPQTPAQLNTEINTLWPDGCTACITPFSSRQTLLDVVASWGNAGTSTNILNVQTANYTIAPTDCGKTVQAGTGVTGYFTVTLPTVTGFVGNCVVTVVNSDTARGKGLVGFPAPAAITLFPSQSVTAQIVNGAWFTSRAQGRWRAPGNVTLFVDNILGTTQDCLAAGVSACASPLTAINRAMGLIDFNNFSLTIQFASGQTYNNLTYQGGTIGLLSGTTLDGGGSTFTSATSAEAFLVNSVSGELLTLQNMVIGNTSTGDGLYVHQGNVAFGAGMVFGSTGRFHIHTQYTSLVNATASYTVNGGAQAHIFTEDNSTFNLATGAILTLSGTPAFSTAFAQASTNSTQTYFGTISGAATGKRYIASNNGMIYTLGAGGGPTYLPGNASGSVSLGGNYDLPGTPVASSCGTSPGAPAGTDLSGSVVEGTTAVGCTLAFTTANTPKSCSVNSSSATVQAGLVISTLSATQLIVTHPSASGAMLYWNCPAP